MLPKDTRFCRPDDLGKRIGRGFFYPLDRLKMLQQRRLGNGTDSLNAVEFGNYLSFAPAVAVVSDTETVCLIAQMLHNPERFGILIYI